MTNTTKTVTVDGTKVAETKRVKAKPTAKKATTAKPTRADLLALLDQHKYTGPRSFTATTLSGIVEWLDAKAPKDKVDGVPTGAVYAVHPDLKPEPVVKARRLSAGYLSALADVLAVLDGAHGGDVRAFVVDGLATGEAKS